MPEENALWPLSLTGSTLDAIGRAHSGYGIMPKPFISLAIVCWWSSLLLWQGHPDQTYVTRGVIHTSRGYFKTHHSECKHSL